MKLQDNYPIIKEYFLEKLNKITTEYSIKESSGGQSIYVEIKNIKMKIRLSNHYNNNHYTNQIVCEKEKTISFYGSIKYYGGCNLISKKIECLKLIIKIKQLHANLALFSTEP